VPCHRVIGSDGSLTGFGGGLRNKEILLELESGQGRLL
jgi:methylated-DNA-[protein]-cysteine S-methyltransferase